MKFFLALIIICHNHIGSFSQSKEREIFELELGYTKAEAYCFLEKSFELFLKKNYPEEQTQPARIRQLLRDILDEKDWRSFKDPTYSQVLSTMENRGLRKDILIFKNEKRKYPKDYDIDLFLEHKLDSATSLPITTNEDFEELIKIDKEISREQKRQNKKKRKEFYARLKKTPEWNNHGLFLYALAKSMHSNTDIMKYVELKSEQLDIFPPTMAEYYLTNLSDGDLATWYYKIPLIIDIYYFGIFYKYKINN